MMTITEDYVSFEIAKLLKEKGFDGKCSYVWIINKANNPEDTDGVYKMASPYFMEGESYVSNEDINRVLEYFDEYYYKDAFLCPTLSVVMKWLREVHYLHITVHPGVSEYGFVWTYAIVFAKEAGKGETHFYKISQITTPIVKSKSYEQACEAAIKYCLENLI